MYFFFFFFKQKTAYEMRISDWSSDVCSSDLALRTLHPPSRTQETGTPRPFGAGRSGSSGGSEPGAWVDPTPLLKARQWSCNSLIHMNTLTSRRDRPRPPAPSAVDRKSTRLNSSH